jgi:hypothetical protein
LQLEKTGKEPALGSPRVPLKDPLELKVPASSIADPVEAIKGRGGVVTPLFRLTEPLIDPEAVPAVQVLVELTVPSESTSKCAFSVWPSASDPAAQPVVGCNVNVQLPETWPAVAPVPPNPMNGSVVLSQAATDASNARQRTMDLT